MAFRRGAAWVFAGACLCIWALPVRAEEKVSWRGCAMDFVRNFSDLGNLRLDVPPEKLGANAKLLAGIIEKQGLAVAAMQVHGAYAKCTESLAKEGRPRDPEEEKASECAAGIVGRASILARIRNGETREVVELALPKEVTEVVRALYQTSAEESFTKAAWVSLQAGVDCVDAARKQ